jgi:hypothetical protein
MYKELISWSSTFSEGPPVVQRLKDIKIFDINGFAKGQANISRFL